MLSTINFFVGFRIGNSNGKIRYNKVIKFFVSMLQIWNLKHYKYFFIIKCISLQSIIFAININVTTSSFKVFSIFYYGFFC